ncbi:MAG TPA: hypothetical protein VFP55_14960 [Solirubrobacteraceae bacterium]|nr:hypothetical protein [Solirubrobacteraceae bacterium]
MRRSLYMLVVPCAATVALTLPSAAAAKNVTVYPGGPAKWAAKLGKKTGAGINNFLINKVVIRVGDSVTWSGQGLAGGFHTVDIPALHGSDLPLILPSSTLVSGVNDFAGNPFWFNGKVPEVGFNPVLFGPSGGNTYNGTSRIDSGLPGTTKNFTVTFTKKGTFKYYCDVHPGMGGEIVVKNKHAKIPTAAQNARTLSHEERNYVKEAKKVLKTKVAAGQVSLGKSGPGGLEIFAMFPSTLTVKAGTTVKFVMSRHSREVHTASFGPSAYLTALANSIAGGAPDPRAVYPSDPPGSITLGPTTHGNGFANTGLLDHDSATPTIPAVGAIKFTTPGTYNYQCLIHTFMHGKIVVTP